MSQIKVVPLGAGQDVGRSCIIVSLGGRNIMFDCGMHMGYSDERRFPNFKYLSPDGNFTDVIDVVIISHFHLDHCGALPYFSEICGYNGPIVMTYPTKAICPILLEDFRKITVERKGETNFFTSHQIKECMKKVIAVNIHQTITIGTDIEVKAYYAGHVLGAAMFYVKVGNHETHFSSQSLNNETTIPQSISNSNTRQAQSDSPPPVSSNINPNANTSTQYSCPPSSTNTNSFVSCVYTGDYNMTPDRHLGAAQIENLNVDLLITETTYATTIRDSKRLRERDFLQKVHDTVERGGKVLIPVFALGRAQELCILIETYWERMNLGHVPVYFSAGLVEKANLYYKLFINWTNQKIKESFVHRNMFDFKFIKPFERGYADRPGPMVLFATPGMLHAGMSLEVFRKWCGNELNMCILPGYCVAGTVGNKILSGSKRVEIDKKTQVDVKLQVKSLSFSAHADAKGILQLIHQCEPKNVMLVHGEKGKMSFLKERIEVELGIPCYTPANGEVLTINLTPMVPVQISSQLLAQAQNRQLSFDSASSKKRKQPFEVDETQSEIQEDIDDKLPASKRTNFFSGTSVDLDGILVMGMVSSKDSTFESNPTSWNSLVTQILPIEQVESLLGISRHVVDFSAEISTPLSWKDICDFFTSKYSESAQINHKSIQLHSICIKNTINQELKVFWEIQDNELAETILDVLEKPIPQI